MERVSTPHALSPIATTSTMSDQQAQIVYTDLKDGSAVQGKLFDGLKFWIAMRCPMRSSFIEQIKSNGGQIVPLEKHADHLIADHARKDNPPGSISYRFIEQSVRNGVLEDPEDHLAGPPAGEIREVASARPTKGTRNPFTPDEDRQLYKWAKDHERKGGRVLGNEIYKQLEAVVRIQYRYSLPERKADAARILVTHGSHGETDT